MDSKDKSSGAGARETPEPSSPVCYANEADPAYMGYMTGPELVAFLNTLLEAERAGAEMLADLLRDHDTEEARALRRRVRQDEARYCALLTRLVEAAGGTPSTATGALREEVPARPDRTERLALLNRGQGRVARRLDEGLPRIRDDAVHAALSEMRDTHRRNVEACERLLAGL